MSHSTTQSTDYPTSETILDSLIIFNSKNSHHLDYNIPWWLSREISDDIEFQFGQVLDPSGIIIIILLTNSFPFVFAKMKTEAAKSTDISQSHFSGHNGPNVFHLPNA